MYTSEDVSLNPNASINQCQVFRAEICRQLKNCQTEYISSQNLIFTQTCIRRMFVKHDDVGNCNEINRYLSGKYARVITCMSKMHVSHKDPPSCAFLPTNKSFFIQPLLLPLHLNLLYLHTSMKRFGCKLLNIICIKEVAIRTTFYCWNNLLHLQLSY